MVIDNVFDLLNSRPDVMIVKIVEAIWILLFNIVLKVHPCQVEIHLLENGCYLEPQVQVLSGTVDQRSMQVASCDRKNVGQDDTSKKGIVID
jgi:hypothetical protein